MVRGELAGRAHDELRREHRTNSSGAIAQVGSESPALPIAELARTPYSSTNRDGGGKGWGRRAVRKALGLRKELVLIVLGS